MASFLHTMVRVTDSSKSRVFYEALGFRFSSEMDIVRNGELEATNYFFSIGDSENVLELTLNHDGRTYELGTGYGHIAIGVEDLDATLAALAQQGIERDMDIVRNGELEATNYFFSIGDQENVLELTFNHDGRTYDLGTGYGHIAIGVDDLDETLARLKEQGIEPERPPYQVREGGSFIAFVRDPDDYRVEIIERST